MAGQRRAKEGLRKMIDGLQQGVESLSAALAAYRMHLYHEGTEERGGEAIQGQTCCAGPRYIKHEQILG
jgi:hypothetical protein